MSTAPSLHFAFIVHYFPPINSSGAKRVEALSKYLSMAGHRVTVIATRKTSADGAFSEKAPPGVEVVELDALGRDRPSIESSAAFEPMYSGKPSWKRRVKDWVMNRFGQIPDPRLPFAFAFAGPWLASRARVALASADVVIGSSPPWPMLLAARIAKRRFGIPCILDYRDHFSECHEMPGGPFAKWLERHIDRWLVRGADHIVAISPPMAGYYQSMSTRVATILNGYDHEILARARQRAEASRPGRVIVRYMGIVSPGRVPHNLMKALVTFRTEQPERFARLGFEFYGNAALIDDALREHYPSIRDAFSAHDPVPYARSLQLVVEADYLLFAETSSKATLSAAGILTTKLFEYIGSGRPVLADISKETLAGSLLLESGNHHVVANDAEPFLQALRRDDFWQRRPDELSANVWKLSRQAQAQEYATLAEQIALRT